MSIRRHVWAAPIAMGVSLCALAGPMAAREAGAAIIIAGSVKSTGLTIKDGNLDISADALDPPPPPPGVDGPSGGDPYPAGLPPANVLMPPSNTDPERLVRVIFYNIPNLNMILEFPDASVSRSGVFQSNWGISYGAATAFTSYHTLDDTDAVTIAPAFDTAVSNLIFTYLGTSRINNLLNDPLRFSFRFTASSPLPPIYYVVDFGNDTREAIVGTLPEVVAPEPATWAAMASAIPLLAARALARRRRSARV